MDPTLPERDADTVQPAYLTGEASVLGLRGYVSHDLANALAANPVRSGPLFSSIMKRLPTGDVELVEDHPSVRALLDDPENPGMDTVSMVHTLTELVKRICYVHEDMMAKSGTVDMDEVLRAGERLADAAWEAIDAIVLAALTDAELRATGRTPAPHPAHDLRDVAIKVSGGRSGVLRYPGVSERIDSACVLYGNLFMDTTNLTDRLVAFANDTVRNARSLVKML